MTRPHEDVMTPSTPGSRITVLYIMGLWRSGSTILDIVLGNHERVTSVGELRSLPAAWVHGATCGCGAAATDCPFWTSVRADWQRRVGGDRTERLLQLEDRYERLRSLPALLASGVVGRTAAFREYGDLVRELYQAIAQASGKDIIVDSTKYPGRALALMHVPGIDVRLVHLIRDGRAVIWSWRRKPNTDLQGNEIVVAPEDVVPRTTRRWLRVNLMSGLVSALAGSRAMRLRYEDLVADPGPELQRIGRLLNLDLGPLAERLIGGNPLESGHTIAGNRVRHQGAVRLKPDFEWRDKLPASDRRQFWRRAGWLARRYGYVK
jgi:hypothetical protein